MARRELEILGRRYIVVDWWSADAMERDPAWEEVPAWHASEATSSLVLEAPSSLVLEAPRTVRVFRERAPVGGPSTEAPNAAAAEASTTSASAGDTRASGRDEATRDDAPDDEPRRDWIEILLLDEADAPVTRARCIITLPDGSEITRTTDQRGLVRVDHIPVGECQVRFPELDREAWAPATSLSTPG